MTMVLRLCAIAAVCLLAASGTAALAQTGDADGQSLEGTVQVGALVPVIGDGFGYGPDILATPELAESEINGYL